MGGGCLVIQCVAALRMHAIALQRQLSFLLGIFFTLAKITAKKKNVALK